MIAMRRRLLMIFACVSLVAGVAIAVLWVRSYLPDYLGMRSSRGRLILIFSHPQWSDNFDSSSKSAPDAESMLAMARATTGSGFDTSDWHVMGFELIVAHTMWGYTVAVLPLWALFLPLAAFTIAAFTIHRRQERRAKQNCCLNCGYDMRATPGRCPECGTAAIAGKPIAN